VAAIVLAVALIIPLVEEAVKTVGVGLRMYRRPAQSEALLWGVACGAGFAAVEGMLNTVFGLDVWAAVVLFRVGATLLHCFTGALMGLAWYSLCRQRGVRRAFGLFCASIAAHGLWNLLSIGISLPSVATLESQTGGALLFSSGLGGLAASLLVTLALAVALALVTLVRHARLQWAEPYRPYSEGVGLVRDT
jgi:RsiW-degrading membrane proteinase PrsW (M82 family)